MLHTFFGKLILPLLAVTIATQALAQDPIEGLWYNDKKSAKVQIYKSKDSKYYGKIVWLQIPDRNGKPKTDEHNPDAAKKSRPILGLVILSGFEKDDEGEYEDGKVYDPHNGKTYSCKMTLKGNELDIRGYIGMPAFGRTTTFTRAN